MAKTLSDFRTPDEVVNELITKLITPGAGGDEKIALIACELGPELLQRIIKNRPDLKPFHF